MPVSAERPSLRYFYSEELRAKAIHALDALEQAEDATRHRTALGDLVAESTHSGMDYYFLEPLTVAKMGLLAQQSAILGVTSAVGIMAPVIRTVIGFMDHDQLLAIARYVRQLMH